MIHNYENWKLMESFGNGEELFYVDVDVYGKEKNLEVTKPLGWSDIDDISGKLTYRAQMVVDRYGIEDIEFSVVELAIHLYYTTEEDPGDNDWKETELVFKEGELEEDISITVNKLPFYIDMISVDLINCEDEDGEIDPKKATIEVEIGNTNSEW
jgi:hypothetical protein